VAGVAADDGTILWDTDAWKISIATVPSPVDLGDGRIFLSGGYDSGCMMLQLRENDGHFAAEVLWRLPAAEFGATQQTPVYFEGRLYGIRPDGQLACLSPEGKILWTSGPSHQFGLGPLLIAGRYLYALNDMGELTVADAGADMFQPIAKAKVLQGPDSWGPMTMVDSRLIVRDLTSMVCLDVSGKTRAK
jgi:outer membrane protein assembly factor BamB